MDDKEAEGVNETYPLIENMFLLRALYFYILVQIKGMFTWNSGEPFDPEKAKFNKWADKSVAGEYNSDDEKDCVTMDPAQDWAWTEEDCSSSYSFICMKSIPMIFDRGRLV